VRTLINKPLLFFTYGQKEKKKKKKKKAKKKISGTKSIHRLKQRLWRSIAPKLIKNAVFIWEVGTVQNHHEHPTAPAWTMKSACLP